MFRIAWVFVCCGLIFLRCGVVCMLTSFCLYGSEGCGLCCLVVVVYCLVYFWALLEVVYRLLVGVFWVCGLAVTVVGLLVFEWIAWVGILVA